MSGKSRHGRGKHSPQSKKRSGRYHLATVVQQAVAQTYEPVSRPNVPAPVGKCANPDGKTGCCSVSPHSY